MSLQTSNIGAINGVQGPYSDKIQNKSVAYGRNSVANYNSQMLKLQQALPSVNRMSRAELLEHDANGFKVHQNTFNNAVDSFEKTIDDGRAQIKDTPQTFELSYMNKPSADGSFDKMALLGASFEEMGKKVSIPLAEMNKKIQDVFGQGVTMNAFDVNKDNQIDVGEYAASVMMEDMLGQDPNKFDYKNLTGTITEKGQLAFLKYMSSTKPEFIEKEVALLHKAQELDKAKDEFVSNPNNIVD